MRDRRDGVIPRIFYGGWMRGLTNSRGEAHPWSMTTTCEETVVRDGQRTTCDRPLDDRGYCGFERFHEEEK